MKFFEAMRKAKFASALLKHVGLDLDQLEAAGDASALKNAVGPKVTAPTRTTAEPSPRLAGLRARIASNAPESPVAAPIATPPAPLPGTSLYASRLSAAGLTGEHRSESFFQRQNAATATAAAPRLVAFDRTELAPMTLAEFNSMPARDRLRFSQQGGKLLG